MSIVITKDDIIQSINENRFCLYYQGIFNINTSSMYGVEALLRWKHSKYENISPEIFIPKIEEYGLMDKLGRIITRNAINDLKMFNEKLNPLLIMSINLSPRQLSVPFVNFIEQLIQDTKIMPSLLQFEIIETSLLDNYSIQLLEKLRNIGVRLAIDDFGKGYSFYDQLLSIKFHTIKVDKVFLNNIDKNHQYKIALESIIDLANRLKIEVIIEGVETFEQVQYLKKIKCKLVQGFFFCKPVPSLIFIKDEQFV